MAKLYYPNGSVIRGKKGQTAIEIFIELYSHIYDYLCKDVELEVRIANLLERGIVDRNALVDIVRWKTNGTNADYSEGIVTTRYRKFGTQEIFGKLSDIGEINDYNIAKILKEFMDCDGYGAVYALTIIYFYTKGKYPIYDKYAHIALMMITENSDFSRIITDSERSGKFNYGSKNIQKVYDDYKNYIGLLKKVFGEKWRYDRRVDKALWVYGHLFSDTETNKKNKKNFGKA